MSGRPVRLGACGVLAADLLALVVAVGLHVAAPAAAAPAGERVVSSDCIGGHVVQGIDDGDPAGLLARDTGVSC